jgi:tRNA threonylcarbamoyl adenosine modification protein YeaZ
MPLIGRVMRQADLAFSALDRIGVTCGPGSFTGLRVGIAAARGIALAAGKPAFGLTTLQAYAAPMIAADDKATVVAAIDARHGHVYLQVFGPGGRTIVAPRLASLADAVRAAPGERVHIVGNAADMLAFAWPARLPAPVKVEMQSAPDIIWVGRLTVAAGPDTAAPKPLYLRAPDAQPQDAARLPRR